MLPRPHTNQQRYELIDKPRNVLGKAQNVARERKWGLNELFLKQRGAQWKLSGRDVTVSLSVCQPFLKATQECGGGIVLA